MLLSLELQASLHRLNPWWTNEPQRDLPPTKRHLVGQILKRLEHQLAPIIVVRGSRQIGKTTSQLQVIQHMLDNGIDRSRILRVQFDDLGSFRDLKEPILRIVEWFEKEILKASLNRAAHDKRQAFIFLDEVQNLENWAEELKSLVDHSTVQVVVTGSSALRIERGRDSLAGRINTIESGVLSITEIGIIRGLQSPTPFLGDSGLGLMTSIDFWRGLRDYGIEHKDFRVEAFSAFDERGGYPIAHLRKDVPWAEVADQLNETVIKRVIQHDLRIGNRGRQRDAALLEEMFRLCCRYAGQSVTYKTMIDELKRLLDANIGSSRTRSYLTFLAESLLIRLIQPLEIRNKKKKSAPKICLVDHSLRTSWLHERISLAQDGVQPEAVMTLAGHIAESVCGSVLSTISGLDISHWPGKRSNPELDFVLTIGDTRIPIEVKYQNRIDNGDLSGIRSFLKLDANQARFGILVTKQEEEIEATDVVCIPLSTLMLLR